MVIFPNCKINLGLHVVNKRNDGFHNIETIFYPVSLCDSLEINLSKKDKDELFVYGIDFRDPMEDNLVYKALLLLRKDFNIPFLRIDLLKKIPLGAGLGGGSSDAAFMLKLCNKFCDLNLTDDQLENYARQLGSDCAFFIRNQVAYAEEKGDVFSNVEVSLGFYKLLIVKPEVHVSTADAYRNVKPRPSDLDLRDIIKKDVSEWQKFLINDFEKGIFEQFPVIGEIKKQMYDLGASYSCMSGSGASVFGLFRKIPEDIETQFADCFVYTEK